VAAPVWCSGCGALAFCSRQHAQAHAAAAHSLDECNRMQQQMANAAGLANTGLDYSTLLAGDMTPGPGTSCFQLELCGAHYGVVRALCDCASPSAALGLQEKPAGARHASLLCASLQIRMQLLQMSQERVPT
jgi:hypothetical protein